MSIATEISRIQTDRNTIRNKLISFGLATSADNLDLLAAAIDGIVNRGAVSAEVQEGQSYTIPAGYHDGGGVVLGVAGGGNYNLQSKTATPTKSQQAITADQGYYGLSGVTVEAIPAAYQDVTSVTAAAADVLATKVFVTSDGTVTAGAMTNNGAISVTLSSANSPYTVPAGFHDGEGTITLAAGTVDTTDADAVAGNLLLSKTAYVNGSKITGSMPNNGAVDVEISSAPYVIPAGFHNGEGTVALAAGVVDTSDADAVAANILLNKTAYVNGNKVIGGMANNGAINEVIDTDTTSYSVPAGYTSGGTVSLVTETKSATPTTSSQSITPTTGKVLSEVTVGAIPSQYGDATGKTATSADILYGVTAVGISSGSAVTLTGSMPNNGAVSATINGLTTTSYTVPAGYHNGNGTVSLNSDIEDALAAI